MKNIIIQIPELTLFVVGLVNNKIDIQYMKVDKNQTECIAIISSCCPSAFLCDVFTSCLVTKTR